MKTVNELYPSKNGNRPEKILQFGEGNFLRAFVDWMIDKANNDGVYNGSIVLCQPIAQGLKDLINQQDGVYTLVMRGAQNGEPVENVEVLSSVSRCINPYEDYDELLQIARSEELEVVVSNTTEAGISYHEGDKLTDRPPASFPAKVTALLYERYQHFNGDASKGLLFLPVELIDNNGAELKKLILRYAKEWELPDSFIDWVNTANHFTSTLVDRIVTGYPRAQIEEFQEKLGYVDNVLDTSELFNLWVIEGDKEWADILPIHKTDANVLWTDDVKPYKKRKVRILNGAHTSTVLAAYLAGFDIVRDYMNDDAFRTYEIKIMNEEIIPTIDLPKEELQEFADAVLDRFANPFIDHKLLDISLNSCSKFHARCLPTILDYVEQKKEIPKLLTFAFAAFMRFYRVSKVDQAYLGKREDGSAYEVKDDPEVLSFFEEVWKENSADAVCHAVLSNTDFWGGQDLTTIAGLEEAVLTQLRAIEEKPIHEVVKSIIL